MAQFDSEIFSIETKDVSARHEFDPGKSPFNSPVKMELLDNGYDFVLLENMTFYFYLLIRPYDDQVLEIYQDIPQELFDEFGNIQSGQILLYVSVTVKENFKTDLVSAPKPLWWFQSPLGLASKPAILHDLFYRLPIEIPYGESTEPDGTIVVSQYLADHVFKLGLEVRGLPAYKCVGMYYALRLFGSANFNGHK